MGPSGSLAEPAHSIYAPTSPFPLVLVCSAIPLSPCVSALFWSSFSVNCKRAILAHCYAAASPLPFVCGATSPLPFPPLDLASSAAFCVLGRFRLTVLSWPTPSMHLRFLFPSYVLPPPLCLLLFILSLCVSAVAMCKSLTASLNIWREMGDI